MTTSNEERILFGEIQKRLLYMVPEKWESIHLYASIVEEKSKKLLGEMYFYYIPKGILKRKPVNVYQIPSLFNIDEESYNQLVQRLYTDIKNLRNLQKEQNNRLWSNLTITIESRQFKIEYGYEDLGNKSEFSPYERHIIWRYKNLGIDPELQTREEKDIIRRYLGSNLLRFEQENNDFYVEGIYKEQEHNIIDYERTLTLEAAIASQQEEIKEEPKKVHKKREKNKHNTDSLEVKQENENQILFGRVDNMKKESMMPRQENNRNYATQKGNVNRSNSVPRKKKIDIDNDTVLSSDFMRRKD